MQNNPEEGTNAFETMFLTKPEKTRIERFIENIMVTKVNWKLHREGRGPSVTSSATRRNMQGYLMR